MKKVLLASLQGWVDHRGASKGAALAFYALFSMTPIMMLAIAVAGYFFGTEAAQGEVIAQLPVTVGPNGAKAIQALLAAAQDPDTGRQATIFAGILLLVAATSVFAELKESLDEMWGIPQPQHHAFLLLLRTRLLAFGLVLILALLLLVSLVCGAALSVLANFAGEIWGSSTHVFLVISSLLSFGLTAALFAVIYKMLPEAPPVLARCLGRRRVHRRVVRIRQICGRPVSEQNRRGFQLWRGGIADSLAALGVLFSTDLFPRRGVHPAVCFAIWEF